MDHNTPTNGTGSDKRNWRERLGIGAREMPRISDEFKAVQPPPLERAPPRMPQPVSRPAPMAPRVASPKSPTPDEAPRGLAQSSPQAASPLADKLKAQRAAAEKLAVQRVSAARERAEAKQAPNSAAPPPVNRPAPAAASAPKLAEPATGKPKFTFAEEEFVSAKKEAAPPPIQPPIQPILRQGGVATPPLTPPRPALGGERTQVPLLRPAAAQPQFRSDPPPVYRPPDPPAGYAAARGRPFNLETGTSYGSRVAARRGAYEPYRRGPDAAGYEPSIHPDEARGSRPLAARARPTPQPVEEDYGDEFEEELPRSRHRASASEYNSAYRDVEESYRDDHRRSSGPWLLLLALLVAAAAAGGGIWLYQTKFKSFAGSPATDTVPVVAAPEGAAKTAAEVPADAQPEVTTASKKKIYDRIVGDQEVTEEQMAPVEGAPLQPEPQQAGEDNPPLTDSGVLTDESNPLPLPPPPSENSGDTQGILARPTTQQSTEAKPEDVQRVIAKPVASATEDTAALMPATGEPEPLPPPEPSMEQMAAKAAEPVSTDQPVPQMPAESETALTAPPAEEQAAATETAAPAPAAKKKAAAAAKKKKAAAAPVTEEAAAEPVVLVPPSQSADILPPSQDGSTGQITNGQAVQAPARTKKKKTLMDLFGDEETSSNETPATPVNTADQGQMQGQGEQVASLPDPVPEAPPSVASGGSGYVVQLASFRSKAEAQAEYSRLASKHSGIVGSLPSRVSQAKVSGSTRYRLGLGPLASREEASKVCSSLVAAGERDCLVRRQ